MPVHALLAPAVPVPALPPVALVPVPALPPVALVTALPPEPVLVLAPLLLLLLQPKYISPAETKPIILMNCAVLLVPVMSNLPGVRCRARV